MEPREGCRETVCILWRNLTGESLDSEAKVGEGNEVEDESRGMKLKSALGYTIMFPSLRGGRLEASSQEELKGDPGKRYRHLGFPPFKRLACHLQKCPPLIKIHSHTELPINAGSFSLKNGPPKMIRLVKKASNMKQRNENKPKKLIRKQMILRKKF